MDATPRLNLPYIAPQQAQKQVTYNEAMKALDRLVQPVVLSRTIATPPGGPAEGECYLVAAAPTGAWTGKAGKIACYVDAAWTFSTPLDGWMLFVVDANEFVLRQAGAWNAIGSIVGKLGVNATPDLTNRLSVASPASLFSHEGAGHKLFINKAATGDTASLMLQMGLSGRAEIGLAGDDNLHFKVSPDGSSWTEALSIDRTSGKLGLPVGQIGFPASQNASADPNTLDDYEEGTWTPGIAFGGASVGVTYGANNGGKYTKIGRLCVATCLLQLTSKGSSVGAATLTGLPLAAPASVILASLTTGWAAAIAGASGAIQGTLASGGSIVSLYQSGGGASVALTNSNFGNTSQFLATISYDVA
jgi:hypothetical protein